MSATKRETQVKKQKLAEAKKDFTRARADRELSEGADFTDKKFTHHRNYHIRYRAWMLAGGIVPDTKPQREELCSLLTKGCTPAKVEQMQRRLGLIEEEEKAAA